MEQSKLTELMVTFRSPKGHKIQRKKFYQKDHIVKAMDFDGIINAAEQLGRDYYPNAILWLKVFKDSEW